MTAPGVPALLPGLSVPPHGPLGAALSIAMVLATTAWQDPAAERFFSRSRTFSLELPAGWRQITPDEALTLRPLLPPDMHRTEPTLFYSVGPIDDWLDGRYSGVSLQVVEQREEWPIDDSFLDRLRTEWAQKGRSQGVAHEVLDASQAEIGPDRREVIECQRRTSLPGKAALRALDVYAPTGGRMVLLSFRCREADFDLWEPRFRRALATLTFARRARGSVSLEDKLLWPIATGVIVGIVLALLYRRRRTG